MSNDQPVPPATEQREVWTASDATTCIDHDCYSCDVVSSLSGGVVAKAIGRTPQDAKERAKKIAALPDLFAYANARSLFDQGVGSNDFGPFLAHLRSLGWDGKSGSGSFVHELLNAALAKSGGVA